MIKCVLTFVSGVQESVLVNFISQNKVKILHKVKITRWATWLRAALYYSENLPAVRTIVNN